MQYERITYVTHESDYPATKALARLVSELGFFHLENNTTADDLARILAPIRGHEPACAPHDVVVVLALDLPIYNGHYFKILSKPNQERFADKIPIWAKSAKRIVAFNSHADIQKQEPGTQRTCYARALLQMHANLGGWRHQSPKKKRPGRGHKARGIKDRATLQSMKEAYENQTL